MKKNGPIREITKMLLVSKPIKTTTKILESISIRWSSKRLKIDLIRMLKTAKRMKKSCDINQKQKKLT